VVQLIISQHNPPNDILRCLVNMRQRRHSQDVGNELIGAINYPSPIPRVGRNPTVSIYTLPRHLQKIANNLPHKPHRSIHSIMEYQKDCWENILTSNEPLIICAPTGLGKTEAFLLPVIDRVITRDSLGILIYPRRELIADQLSRILEICKNIQNTYGITFRVGIQFEGIGNNISSTLLYNHYQRNRPFNRIQDINDLLKRYRGNVQNIPRNITRSRNKIVSMQMVNECYDEVLINLPRLEKCPVCGNGYIRAEVWYNPASGTTSRGYQLRGGFNRVTDFKCTNSHCSTVYELSLSKEDHISKNVHLLITTIESLEILLMDPNFSRWFKDRLEFLVFDEIHVYHSIYGAHIANIVRRIKAMKEDTKLIGVSATIDDPHNFGQKFFNISNIKVISPSSQDIRQLPHHEYYYFVRSRLNATPLSVYIQIAMFLGHSLIPRGKKMLVFFDSRDLVYRARNQLIDAENNELWRFRVEPSQITFNNSCQGPFPNCYLNCPIFASGECWYALPNVLNLQHMPINSALGNRDIEGVTAMGREYNPNARIINTTSVLELGLDDPNVIFIGQYKAPHTVYSFLQRKGRGGRTPNDDIHVFMILGNDTSDLFYFKRAESIISQPYTLPLEPNNPSIKYIHDLLQLITDRILNCVNTTASPPHNINERCAWEVMLNILCDNFKIFLARTFGLTLSASNILPQRSSLCTIVQNSIQNKKNRINQILAQYNVSTSPVQALQNYIQKLTAMSSQLPQNVQNLVTRLVSEFNSLIISLSQQNQQGINNSTNSIVNTCAQILPMLLVGHPLYNEVLDILNKIPSITGQLPQHTYEVEKLRYEIESLLELCKSTTWGPEGALNSISPNRIVKYLLRSWYFYCKACKINHQGICPNHGQSGGVRYPMNICPLIAYFDEPVNLILDVGGRTQTITDIDALFNYIPYKTIVEAEGTRPYIISVKPPVDVQSIHLLPTGVWQFNIAPSYFEGRGWIHENEVVITPEIIHAEKFDLDPQAETLLKFCERCFNYYDFNYRTCPADGSRLRTVRLYVEPLIERSFVMHKENKISNYLSIAELTGYHKLSQLDIEVLRYFWDQNSGRWVPGRRGVSNPMKLRGKYSTPIVFSTTTKGILLKLSKDFLDKILDDKTRKYLAHKNSSHKEIVFHTIAHVLLLLVSSISGVNPEILWYGWDSKKGIIAIWERYEGGSGICETFREILQKDPTRVYEELKKIVECPVHESEKNLTQINLNNPQNPFPPDTLEYTELQNLLSTNPSLKLRIWRELSNIISNSQNIERYNSREIIETIAGRLGIEEDEVINNFPSCIDGCPFCIGVPYCTSGKDEQYTNISLKVAKKFVECLEHVTKNPDEAINAVLGGGKIVRYDGNEYTIFFL